jgi:phosphoribosylanthranilate isomerase
VVRKIMNECGLRAAQLHGNETAEYCTTLGCSVIKAIRVHDGTDFDAMGAYRVAAFLLDTYISGMPGGTGVAIDLELAGKAQRLHPIILAGGLTPENVGEAIRRLRPYGVDVSSGVEISPGKKDHAKVRAFITAAKAAIPS